MDAGNLPDYLYCRCKEPLKIYVDRHGIWVGCRKCHAMANFENPDGFGEVAGALKAYWRSRNQPVVIQEDTPSPQPRGGAARNI